MYTLFYHGTMVFVALLMLFSKYYTFSNLKDFILAFIPLTIVSIPANIINFTYNCSYMFFRGGFPFSLIADHMPWWLWLIVLYIADALSQGFIVVDDESNPTTLTVTIQNSSNEMKGNLQVYINFEFQNN